MSRIREEAEVFSLSSIFSLSLSLSLCGNIGDARRVGLKN